MSKVATVPDSAADRRRAARTALRLSATMREPGRSRVGVRVIDISTHGCRVEASALVSSDSWVWLSIAGLDTQYCRVVWQHQEFAGLEFATALAEPVLERLLSDQSNFSEHAITELRDIASRTRRLSVQQQDKQSEILAELSRNCAVEAVIEGLRLGGSKKSPKAPKN